MSPPENFLKECQECIEIGYIPVGSMGMTVVDVDSGTFLCYHQSFYHPDWTINVRQENIYRAVLVRKFNPLLVGKSSIIQEIDVKRALEALTGLPREQCENIVTSLKEIKSNLSRTEADHIASVIEGAGGKVHIYNMLGELVSGDA
jgi:hypothetical protein